MDGTLSYEPLQVAHAHDPWRVLVICILLSGTSRERVRPLLPEFFRRWPNSDRLAGERRGPLEEFLRPLGFSSRRSWFLIAMSNQYRMHASELTRDAVLGFTGCGAYAADAVDIFCRGDLSVDPADRVLKTYVEEMR